MSFYDEDEEVVELKRHFIDANVENGCKIASIRINRKTVITRSWKE